MSKTIKPIFLFVLLAYVFFLLGGCGKEEPPPKPKIVSKKIVRDKDAAVTPTQQTALKDQPKDKTTSEKPPIVAQKSADTPKPSSEKPSDQKKLPDVSKPSDSKPEKPAEQKKIPDVPKPSADKAEKMPDQKKLPDAAKPSDDKPEKTAEKPEDKSVEKPIVSENSQKSVDKKAIDLVFPDGILPGKEAQKTVAVNTRDDPFAPLFKEEPKKPKTEPSKSTRILTPLEKLDLSQLKLVGIVRGGSGTRALIEETSGKGYIIKKGTYIGIHSGKVSDILDDKIIIDEEHEDYSGNEIDGWTRNVTVRKREMKLQKSPGDEL